MDVRSFEVANRGFSFQLLVQIKIKRKLRRDRLKIRFGGITFPEVVEGCVANLPSQNIARLDW